MKKENIRETFYSSFSQLKKKSYDKTPIGLNSFYP